jgi:ABC-type sugar transport system substrate-binding protein
MRKTILILLVFTAALVWATTASAAEKKLTIGFTPPSFVSPYWTYIVEAAKQEAAKQGVDIIVTAPRDHTDFDGQIRILEDFVQKKVDAIVMGVVDKAAVVPGQKRANEAGIPIIILNQILPQPGGIKIASYIGVDNIEGGALMGEYCVKTLKEKGDVCLVEGIPGEASNERLEGYMNVIKKYPNIKIIDRQIADWDEGKALTVMENFLQAHSKIDFVFGLCDSMALGGITATKNRNRLKEITFGGYDGTVEAFNSIGKGELSATILQPPRGQGRLGIQTAIKAARKEAVPPIQKLQAQLVTKQNLQTFIDTPP